MASVNKIRPKLTRPDCYFKKLTEKCSMARRSGWNKVMFCTACSASRDEKQLCIMCGEQSSCTQTGGAERKRNSGVDEKE
jgi:hypothetical protein